MLSYKSVKNLANRERVGKMKQKSWFLAMMTLVFSLVVYSISPAVSSAASNSDSNVQIAYDVYQNQESETILIEGTSYTYDYSYEDGNRTIYITNNSDNTVDKVSYHEDNSKIYHNDEVIGAVEDNSIEPSFSMAALNTWETISTDSKYISWAKGIGVSILAGIIAVGLGAISFGATGAIVIAAMGTTALSILASGAVGGTIKIKYQRFMPSFGAPYHRWIWSFTASTGDFYGDYIYQ